MPRFFVPAGQVAGGRAAVLGADAAHLARALRARPGDRVLLVDDAGAEHGVVVESVDPGRVEGAVAWSRPATGEPRLRVHVLQALPAQGMDDAVEAMAEIGVVAIHPFVAERSAARPDARRAAARVERWRSIAREAAGLAGRGAVPEVHDLTGLGVALDGAPPGAALVALGLDAAEPLSGLRPDPARAAVLVVGPEGGLSAAELDLLGRRGATRRHLGARTLRSRLAGTVGTALLLAAAGELDAPRAPDLSP